MPNKSQQQRTTLMLRNLPNDYTRDMLLEMLESRGFSNRFDFVYLPCDFKRGCGLGYAFVNMATPDDAILAMADLQGFDAWKLQSRKVLEVSWSKTLQGLAALIEKFRNSQVMHPEVIEGFKPILLENGRSVQFPAPTRALSSPFHEKPSRNL
jgi:RNA recognition motif-containing protein